MVEDGSATEGVREIEKTEKGHEPAKLKIRLATCNLADHAVTKALMSTAFAFSALARTLLAVGPLALLPGSAAAAARTIPVFFGNYADAIHAADFDPATGALSGDRAVATVPKASFLARSGDGRFLYAVAEGESGTIHAFAVDEASQLVPLNTSSTGGAGPCDVALSPDGRLVAVANYSGGSVSVHRVEPDGRIGEKVAFFAHDHASGTVPDRQEAPHAHGVTWAPGGRLLLVPDLGADRVYLYACDPASLALAPNPPQAWLDLPRGTGPRHACFSPDARHVYIVNELANSVSVAAYNEKAAMLTLVETVSALSADCASTPSKAAEIAVHPSGHSVYASVRGADIVAVFARDADARQAIRVDASSRDAESGRLAPRAHVPVPAKPRHFALSPDARWLLVAGQAANQVAVFSVDRTSGDLTPANSSFATPKPVCLRF